ncbi:hypothetical protein RF11_06132 [Thelohanellus kitauei]|uniref:Uncharacterized protein n=1 Tax=Thelohanellus kitauei TaxID=669202 RepID=A0A0C2MCR2_THEKT|nr:hypothetical protein RF11_06132 [Thelohanellus kitauei]
MDSNDWIRNRLFAWIRKIRYHPNNIQSWLLQLMTTMIRKGNGNDLLVTSPTSALLDLTEVGHVDIFMNINKVPHFSKTSKIAVRGKPVARSYFGWNAESVNDIDGDGIKG